MRIDRNIPSWVAVVLVVASAFALYAAISFNREASTGLAALAYACTFLSLAFGIASLLRDHQGIGWFSLVLAVVAVYATGMYTTASDLEDVEWLTIAVPVVILFVVAWSVFRARQDRNATRIRDELVAAKKSDGW